MGRGQELLDAARKGDVRTVTKILTLITKRSGPFTSLRRGAGVNVQDDNGYTPLHHACMNGHREIVHLLLKVDASPCVVDKKGATPLHLAAWKGDSHVVSMLLGHCNPPVNLDQKTNDQETALLIAAQFGHVDVVAQLIAKGADVSLRNNKEESPLDLASQYGKLETVMQIISAQPQLLDPYRFPIGRGRSFPTTPLHRATMNGHKEVVAYLIAAGMDPNVRTENGTALHEGIRYLQASVVKVLLAKGADLKAKDRMGHSVHALLDTYPEDATKRVKKYIREFENQKKISYESEEDLPSIPVNDYPSPVGGYVNAHGMIRVLPKLGTNSDAITNTDIKKRVFNTSSSSKNSVPSFKRASTKIIKVRSVVNSSTPQTLPSLPDSPGLQPNYVNYEDMLSDETEAMQEVPVSNEIYGNIETVNSIKEQEADYPDSLSGSQNSMKKKPKPPPKPLNQPQKPVISLHELLHKIGTRNANNSKDNRKVVEAKSEVDGKVNFKKDDYSIYGNLPDDEKVKRNGDADSKPDCVYVPMTPKPDCVYVPMTPKADCVYVPMTPKADCTYVSMTNNTNNKNLSRRSVPNYVDMGTKCNAEEIYGEYISMDETGAKKRLSLSDMKEHQNSIPEDVYSDGDYTPMENKEPIKKRVSLIRVRRSSERCMGVHIKGEQGCLHSADDYEYQYVLNPNVHKGDVSPFLKMKSKVGQMPCYCHEEAAKNKGQEVYYSCEEIYVIIDKNQIYSSLNDVSACGEDAHEKPNEMDEIPTKLDLADQKFEPFENTPKTSTSSDDYSGTIPRVKRFSSVFRKKFEQAKQLVTEWKAPETQKNTNINLSLSQSSSSLTKSHQSFVKKLASKCLGLKAKFNSAPNISNSVALDSDVAAKVPNPDHRSSTNTLLIGKSKFFNNILSKKEESGEINCNDEFDTISLDRLGTLNRDSSVNRSNRSCPGFKTSLPNISENAENSDSESVIITEIDSDVPKSQPKEAINLHTKLTIFEPRQRTLSFKKDSESIHDSADLVNECYEPCKFSDNEVEKKVENNNNVPKPLPRVNVAIQLNEEDSIYENVTMIAKRIPPEPAVRNNVPPKVPLDEVQRKALYENISALREESQNMSPPVINMSELEKEIESKLEEPSPNHSSTVSSSSDDSDSMEDETNLEDILLSEKSKSFRRVKKMTTYPSKSEISRTQSNASNISEFTQASAIENVDCSEEIYTTMTGTLPLKSKKDQEKKKKVLFRHKTFTNIEVDRNSVNNSAPLEHYEFMKETLASYHIRGTGHCIHKAPTVEEFIYIFNREALYSDTAPFTLVPNDKRESYYETAICFCKPKVPKYHKSAEDLLQLPYDGEENKVTIDLDALRDRSEIVSTSFRCFCDSGQCTFHAKKRELPNDLIVKFSAVKKSISTPDITLDTSFSAVNRSSSMKNSPATSKTESHYAVTNIDEIVLRNKKLESSKVESPIYTVMSQPSTLSSSGGQYSIKDISDVISLNSHSESTDASPVCALNSAHLPLRKSTSSEYSERWTLASSNSNTTVQSDTSFKTCIEDPEEDSDDGTLHSDEDSSDAETIKSDVSTGKRPWVHSDSFNFGKSGPKIQNYAILEEDSNSSSDSLKFESPSKIESGISVEGSESSSSEGDEDSGIPGVDAGSLGVASLERDAGCGGVRSGSGRRRWDEAEGTSEGDALSISSAASSCAPHHLAHHHDYSKVSPTPPKKPPRRNLSVSPTHANSPSSGYSYELRTHARSQDDLDEIQGAKHYLKHGRSVDQYVDGKLSYSEFEENHNSPRVAPVPNPRPSLKYRSQPVAITAMYENVVIKEQNPRRKLRRNNFGPQNDNEPRMEDRVRKYSNQDRSSLESLLDDQSINSPSDCERYYDGPRLDIPLSPTHYDQPPTPDHPPPSARQAENSIHERIRPLSQEYKRRSILREMLREQAETENLLRAMSVASVASGATDRSGNTDCVEEYVCDVPFAGLFKGSTTTLDGIGLRPMPAERPKTLRKLKSVYDASPTEPAPVTISSLGSNGQGVERNLNGCEDEVRRRSNTNSSTHSGDKSLSILSPFDEQEEWAKISEIMASFGSKLVRESVFVSELEQEFTSRLGLSCSESSLSPSVASNLGLWLSGLGLHDYEPLFLESGFDDVDFVNGILDENDLREMGIEESDRQRILESAKQLPLKITEISNNYNNNNLSKNQNESVEEWLRNINLEIYSDTFRKHLYVDMDRVRRIWEVELTAVLEIQKAGHRKRILASVSGEQNGPANHMEDLNADLSSLKNNIKQLKDDIKEKLPISENLKAVPPPVVPSLAPPGGETLKRSKKNRPAPQPPRPSDLEIRAPSELLVGVPGALKTQWKHQPFVLVTGAVTYVANYLGSTVVKELRGTESTKKSIQKLKKSTKEPRDSPDIILSISYRGVKFLNTITRELICEHEIRNIHCACQDADDLTHFAYITKDHTTKSHYCHVFRVATMDQATEVILTLGEAFEVAYQMALREQSNRFRVTQSQAKTPTHDPMTTSNKEKPIVNHGRSHSITEIKLNGHQLKIAPMPASLSNEDFQSSRNSDGSRSPRTPLLKAPIASTEEL